MKIGIIGIGDIAKKAYLPVLTSYKDIEIYLCSRNRETLKEMAAAYRIKHVFEHIEELIESGIQAAFVHSSTDSHEEVIDKLFDHDIHVYVDKPITYFGDSSKRLIEKAREKGLLLMVGFNRRYAPLYQQLKEISHPNMVMVEKHRRNHPDNTRTFIFDDFIHVIDTLLYLFPYEIDNVKVHGKQRDRELYHVVLQLEAKEGTAIGIMNRDAGMNEEIAKVFSTEETRVVRNINEITIQQGKDQLKKGNNDWEPTLQKRGFYNITRAFIELVKNNGVQDKHYQEDLQRHLIAEKVVKALAEGEF